MLPLQIINPCEMERPAVLLYISLSSLHDDDSVQQQSSQSSCFLTPAFEPVLQDHSGSGLHGTLGISR